MTREPNGFSLVEVVVALGVVGFALIAILGLFPMAMTAARDSQNETRTAFIVQSILGQIQAGNPTNTSIPLGASLTNTSTTDGNLTLNLAVNSTNWMIFNEDGIAIRRGTAAQFDNGGTIPASVKAASAYQARLRVAASQPTNGLSQLLVDVAYPATAGAAVRQTNTYAVILKNSR